MVVNGNVYWITGLAGTGKTTIGELLSQHLKKSHDNVVFLDGEMTRQIFGDDLGHSPADRIKVCMCNARLCKLVSDQGVHVVCSTICLIAEVQAWCSENISDFHQIILDAPMDVLRQRNPIYQRVERKEIDNVVGLDVEPHYPLNPLMKISNDGNQTPEQVVAELVAQLPDI